MESCATYQNIHHQLMVVIGSQQGETCWPVSFKLMSTIKLLLFILYNWRAKWVTQLLYVLAQPLHECVVSLIVLMLFNRVMQYFSLV